MHRKNFIETKPISKFFWKSIIGQCQFIGFSDKKMTRMLSSYSTLVVFELCAQLGLVILAEPCLLFDYYFNTKYVVKSKKCTFTFHLSFIHMFSLSSLFLKFSGKRFIWCFYFLPLLVFTGLACRGFELKIW